ncbi:MAG: hypothetical protein VW835_04585, partial [Rickettsiales bacterium]
VFRNEFLGRFQILIEVFFGPIYACRSHSWRISKIGLGAGSAADHAMQRRADPFLPSLEGVTYFAFVENLLSPRGVSIRENRADRNEQRGHG